MTATCAVLTPPGVGAIAVVEVAGPAATDAVARCWTAANGRPLAAQPLGAIRLGTWGPAGGEEVIVVRHSPDRLEVHCHAGIAAVEAVCGALVDAGCQRVPWQQSAEHAARSPYHRELHERLAHATTSRTTEVLLDQLAGALERAIAGCRSAMAAGDPASADQQLATLATHQRLSAHLIVPWRVVLAGPPNAGKSSLLNSLAGYQRAIVCSTPGTTRDVLRLPTAIEGWPMELCDMAGLRETTDPLERLGVEQAIRAIASADLVLQVAPGDEPLPPADPRCGLLVVTKIDRVSPVEVAALRAALLEWPVSAVATSSTTGAGLPELLATIAGATVGDRPPPGAAVPILPAHYVAIRDARQSLARHDSAAADNVLRALLASLA